MSDQKLTLDLSGLSVETVEVVPADSLDSATYGHGMPELGASCGLLVTSCVGGGGGFVPEDLEDE